MYPSTNGSPAVSSGKHRSRRGAHYSCGTSLHRRHLRLRMLGVYASSSSSPIYSAVGTTIIVIILKDDDKSDIPR